MLFGLLAIPLLVFMGGAVDFMRFNRHKTQLLAAMDAAALSLGQRPTMSNAEAVRFVMDYVENVVPNGGETMFIVNPFTVTKTPLGYEVKSDAVMETAFLPLIGISEIPLQFSTAIENTSNKIELALALDNTGSMRSGGKIEALRGAAATLVDVMYQADRSAERVKISLVPFVTAVNIRTASAYRADWIDATGESRHNGENFTGPRSQTNHMAIFNAMGVPWKGCVEARPEPYDTQLAIPGGIPDTRFVPYLWPDEDERNGDYSNNYINERRGGPPSHVVQKDSRKYVAGAARVIDNAANGVGPNRSCARPVVDLTNDQAHLVAEIEAMDGWNRSGTNIGQGIFWAWNVLTEEEPFSTAAPSTDKETIKAMVVLTDGENIVWNGGRTTDNSSNHNGSDYTSYGYVLKNGIADGRRRGVTSRANKGQANRLVAEDNLAAAQEVDQKVARMCADIKSQKIRIYTITFQLNRPDQQYLRDLFSICASPDGFGGKLYYDSPNNAALQDIFREIARDLSSLRIVR